MKKSASTKKPIESELIYRIEFEKVITRISTCFINLTGKEIDHGLDQSLREIGEFAGVDRSYIYLFTDDGKSIRCSHEWSSALIKNQIDKLRRFPVESFPWAMDKLKRLESVYIPRLADLSCESSSEKGILQSYGVKSVIIVPMVLAKNLIGFLGFVSFRQEKTWSEDHILLLRIVGEIFSNALERKKAEEALQQAEEKYRLMIENAVEGFFQSTPEGKFLSVNPAMAHVFGYESPEELITSCTDIASQIYVQPEKREEFKRLVEDEEIIRDFEYQAYRKDKRIIWLLETCRAVRNDKGDILYYQGTARDITDRKKAEEIIQKRHAQLELIHHIQSGIPMNTDIETILMNAAESMGKSFGYYKISVNLFDKETEEIVYLIGWNKTGLPLPRGHRQKLGKGLIGQAAQLKKTIVANDVTKEAAYFAIITDTKSELTIPLLVKDKLIGVLDLQDDRLNAFTEDDVSVIQSVANYIAYIINEKLEEEELRKERDRVKTEKAYLDALYESVKEAIVLTDKASQVLRINPEFTKLFGYTPEEALGQPIDSLIVPLHYEDEVRSMTEKIARGEQLSIETIRRHKNGRLIHVSLLVSPIVIDHELEAIYAIYRDITERKKAEEELKKSEMLYRALFEHANDAVFLINLNEVNIRANKKAADMLGYTVEELVGKPIKEIVAPSQYDLAQAKLKGLIEGKSFPLYERLFRKKDGTEFPVEINISLIRDAENKPLLIQSIVRDITERKLAEEALQTALTEKEILLKEIHHRVKNNMQIISSLLNIQSSYIKEPPSIEIFKESQRRIRSMALIHEMLYKSKSLSAIEFSTYLRSLVSNLFHTLPKSPENIQLNMDVEDLSLDIQTAIPCGLIVNELISNALKHAFPDGKKGEIYIGLHRLKSGEIELMVRDNGVGFPADLDFHNSETMGMQLVTMLAEQLEAQIKMARKKGTEFRLIFKEMKYKSRI